MGLFQKNDSPTFYNTKSRERRKFKNIENKKYTKDNIFAMSSSEEALIFEEKVVPDNLPIIEKPEYVLNYMQLSDDFYSNVLDWKGKNIFYSYGAHLYSVDITLHKRSKIHTFKRMITSVKAFDSKNLIIGFICGNLIIYDLEKKLFYDLAEHASRISTIDIFENDIFTGSRDKSVRHLDFRNNETNIINKHLQEVTGLKINPRGDMLASGGNDNKFFVYDRRTDKAILQNEHLAAVRAIAWSKFNLLATGGGTADRKIKLWNLSNLKMQNEVSFNSQVCNLYWTANNEIISTHGYSQNDVKISNIELKLKKVFYAHKNRVIHFAIDETQKFFVTGSSDNCLKIWKL